MCQALGAYLIIIIILQMEKLRYGEGKCPVKVTAVNWQIRDVKSGSTLKTVAPQAHPESCHKHLFHWDVSHPLCTAPSFSRPSCQFQAPLSHSFHHLLVLGGPSKATLALSQNGASFSEQICFLSQTPPLPGSVMSDKQTHPLSLSYPVYKMGIK